MVFPDLLQPPLMDQKSTQFTNTSPQSMRNRKSAAFATPSDDLPTLDQAAGDDLAFARPGSKTPSESTTATATATSPVPEDDDILWGKTPDGKAFIVPPTHSFIHHLASPSSRKSSLDILTLVMLGAQCLLFLVLPLRWSRIVFLVLFAVFRLAYNVGLGWILRKQSTKRYIVREVVRRGWLDANKRPLIAKWCKKELEGKIGDGYVFEEAPVEFTVWLLFRQVVDVILLNDFVSYSLFAWSFLTFPAKQSVPLHILRWAGGWTLIAFNVWVKVDAHRVVKDYAWYWGDAFYSILLKKDLVFDGVYEVAPHPMYSVGYAGFYGLSIVVASYTVLFVSILAHIAQFGFLLWFENPHIERVYGEKKPLASRVPLVQDYPTSSSSVSGETDSSALDVEMIETPGATEGETATDTELDDDLVDLPSTSYSSRPQASSRSDSFMSAGSSKQTRTRSKSATIHDLHHRYFRRDFVILKNFDIFRAADLSLLLLITYALLSALTSPLSPSWLLAAHVAHALAWRAFHSFGLGTLLDKQSKERWLVRHFVKHYHYPGGEEGAVEEAFNNWKIVYNLSLVMTYVSFTSLAWKTYTIPSDWTVGGQLLRHTLGCMLIALHVWTALSTYEVLGDFGWLYSDFFLLERYPPQLAYTGIYRFLNNPERLMSGAALFGLALISGSKLVFGLAIFSSLSHWWFLSQVEGPHMRKIYGDAVRKDAGLTKTFKNVVSSNAKRFESKDLKRVVQEVKGRIDQVDQKIHRNVEDFLENARPRISEVVQDTKFLLQQSREKLVITRIANVSAIDCSQYKIKVLPSAATTAIPVPTIEVEGQEQPTRFHIGEPIEIAWEAPKTHSRKDWIGIYRLGACKSQLVTRISSVGKWTALYEDEFDGDVPTPAKNIADGKFSEIEGEFAQGKAVLKGDALPWQTGRYELRLHHDGKHNVMARFAPIEIFVPRPSDPISVDSIHSILTRIVTLALDSDPALVPISARSLLTPVTPLFPLTATASEHGSPLPTPPKLSPSQSFDSPDRDEDDFIIMSLEQSKRMVAGIREAFDVEFVTDVILAEPNVGELAIKIADTRRILGRDAGTAGMGGGGKEGRRGIVRSVSGTSEGKGGRDGSGGA